MYTALYILSFVVMFIGFAWAFCAENMKPGLCLIIVGIILGTTIAVIHPSWSESTAESQAYVVTVNT